MAGVLQAIWWAARLGAAALSVAFYTHFAVGEAAGTPCDAPLLAFIVSAGFLSAVLVVLRGAVLAVGMGARPSEPVRFLLLYPVLLHCVEVVAAAAAGAYILLPNEHCALPLSSEYVNWSVVLMVGSWLVAGLVYPLSFDTEPQDSSRRGFRGLETNADASANGAGRFLRDLHGAVLVYRTALSLCCALTFVAVRDGLPVGATSLRNSHPCTDPLVLWLLLELTFHLLTYCCTLYYAARALLWPHLDVRLHETVFWVFLLGAQLPSACGGIILVFGEEAPCYDEAPSLAYMARTGAVLASCAGTLGLCLAPCWTGSLRRRRQRVLGGQQRSAGRGHGGLIAAYGHLPMRNS